MEPMDESGRVERDTVTHEDLKRSPHAVVASVREMDQARVLIEDLEEHGVPPVSIALLGVAPGGSMDGTERQGEAETHALTQLAKSVIVGGGLGIVAGALLGAVVAAVLPGVSFLLACSLAAIFGAGVGGAAGGMSVAKYNSPAWTDTYETVEEGEVAVGVHHAESSVVDAAEEVFGRHQVTGVTRYHHGEPVGG
jgi:hypothetical protein